MANKLNIGIYEKALPLSMPIDKKIEYAYSVGYDFIELSIDETDEKIARLYDSQLQNSLEAIQKKYEKPIHSFCLSAHRKYPLGSIDVETQEKSLEIGFKCIDLADRLDVRLIQLAGYDEYYGESTDQTRDNFLKNLKTLVKYAEEKKVVLAFETMETDFMNTVGKAKHYVDLVESPFLKIYPDIGNIRNSFDSVEETLADLNSGSKDIVAVHVKETVPGIFRDMNFGEGRVEFKEIVSYLLNLPITHYVTEFWNHTAEYEEQVTKNFSYLDNLIRDIENEVNNNG